MFQNHCIRLKLREILTTFPMLHFHRSLIYFLSLSPSLFLFQSALSVKFPKTVKINVDKAQPKWFIAFCLDDQMLRHVGTLRNRTHTLTNTMCVTCQESLQINFFPKQMYLYSSILFIALVVVLPFFLVSSFANLLLCWLAVTEYY